MLAGRDPPPGIDYLTSWPREPADPVAEAVLPGESGLQERLVFVGNDKSGRALEVMAVRKDRGLLVIHAIDPRPKWRQLDEGGKR